MRRNSNKRDSVNRLQTDFSDPGRFFGIAILRYESSATEGGDTAKYEEKYEKIASRNNPEILEIPSK